MRRLGFTSSIADPDVWFRRLKQATGEDYYKYVLLYVDDVICISENAESVIRDDIGKDWELKGESISPPSKYLGGLLRDVTLSNGMKEWAFGLSQYVKAAVTNVQENLRKLSGNKNWDCCLPKRVQTPLSCNYRPEIDISPKLGEADASY